MSLKVYEWILTSRKTIIRQGILCAETKKQAEQYFLHSLNDDEKVILRNSVLTIKQLKL